MNKKDALEFVDYLRCIIQFEHDMTVNHSTSTSESTYIKLENKLIEDMIKLDELQDYIKTDKMEFFSDAELEEELERRKQVKKEIELQSRKMQFAKIIDHRDILLSFVPHSRTSCSDKNPSNGLGSADWGARCPRCALLTVTDMDFEKYDVNLQFDIFPVDK